MAADTASLLLPSAALSWLPWQRRCFVAYGGGSPLLLADMIVFSGATPRFADTAVSCQGDYSAPLLLKGCVLVEVGPFFWYCCYSSCHHRRGYTAMVDPAVYYQHDGVLTAAVTPILVALFVIQRMDH